MVAFCAFIAGFIGIELFSIFFHKYVLHGPLWFIHKTHHKPQAKGLEWNDLVSLSFAIVAIVLIWIDLEQRMFWFWVGLGISLYGLIYYIFHDYLTHRRPSNKIVLKNNYLKALQLAHWAHHKHTNKNPGTSYGLLIFPVKYLKPKR